MHDQVRWVAANWLRQCCRVWCSKVSGTSAARQAWRPPELTCGPRRSLGFSCAPRPSFMPRLRRALGIVLVAVAVVAVVVSARSVWSLSSQDSPGVVGSRAALAGGPSTHGATLPAPAGSPYTDRVFPRIGTAHGGAHTMTASASPRLTASVLAARKREPTPALSTAMQAYKDRHRCTFDPSCVVEENLDARVVVVQAGGGVGNMMIVRVSSLYVASLEMFIVCQDVSRLTRAGPAAPQPPT